MSLILLRVLRNLREKTLEHVAVHGLVGQQILRDLRQLLLVRPQDILPPF